MLNPTESNQRVGLRPRVDAISEQRLFGQKRFVALRFKILFLLGVGWSCCLVASSALLTEAVPAAQRTEVQGATDAAMNISAAIGAAASGPLLGIIGFGGLNALSAVLVLVAAPWVVVGLRARRPA